MEPFRLAVFLFEHAAAIKNFYMAPRIIKSLRCRYPPPALVSASRYPVHVRNFRPRPCQPRLTAREFPSDGEKWSDIMADVESHIMPGITHWQHPRCATQAAELQSLLIVSVLPVRWGSYLVVSGCLLSVECRARVHSASNALSCQDAARTKSSVVVVVDGSVLPRY